MAGYQIWKSLIAVRMGGKCASASVYTDTTVKRDICTHRQGWFCVLGFAFEARLGGGRRHDRLVQRRPAAFHSWSLQNTGLFHDGLVWRGNGCTEQVRKTHRDKTFIFCAWEHLKFQFTTTETICGHHISSSSNSHRMNFMSSHDQPKFKHYNKTNPNQRRENM